MVLPCLHRFSSLGPAEVAAWGLLGTVWDALELIVASIAEGCEVRAASLLGSGQVKKSEFLAYKSLWIGILSAGALSVLLLSLRNEIPKWLTHDVTLQSLLTDVIPMLCIANFASATAIMSGSILYAQNRFSLATTWTFVISIVVTLPLAALSSIVYRFDLKAQTGAVVIGMSLTSALNTFVMIRSDWHALSDAIIATHEHGEDSDSDDDLQSLDSSRLSYDDLDWNDLPKEVKEAARILGYDKLIWNNDMPSPLDNEDWDELTPEQQDAAKALNYTQAKWDGG